MGCTSSAKPASGAGLPNPLMPRPCETGKLRPKQANARFWRDKAQPEQKRPQLSRRGPESCPQRHPRIHCADGETEACAQEGCPNVASGAPHPTTARGPRPTWPGSPEDPASPLPPRTRPGRRWQQHLHIWRPCSRFRDGARAAVTSPRTLRASARVAATCPGPTCVSGGVAGRGGAYM